MPLTCKQIFLRLSDYLDGDLPPELCTKIRQHLSTCPECRAFTNTLRKTIEFCRRLSKHHVPFEVSRKLRAMVRTRLAKDRSGTPPRLGR
jgi:anti-sigma factor RsiW